MPTQAKQHTTVVVPSDGGLVERIWATLERDPRVDARAHPLELSLEAGEMTVRGELADVAAKKRAFELIRSFPDVRRIIDRVAVQPAVLMGDGEIRDHVRNAFLGEPSFADLRLIFRAEGTEDRARDPLSPRAVISASVQDGVVTLEGEVPSLAHARLAGVLAWWVPGTRDVKNRLLPDPPEEDSDEEISEAVRVVLEKEPFVDADQLGVRTVGGRVILFGTLRSEEQRQLIERDVWYVSGVWDVDNRIQVHMP